MRIAFLADGGIFTARWTNAFVELGYEVHLIIQGPIIEEFNSQIKTYHLPFPRPWGGILNVISIKATLNRIKPDLLHVFGASLDGLLGRLSGFHPSILSVLGCDVINTPYDSRLKYRIIVNNLKFYDWIGSTSQMMGKQVVNLYPNVKNLSITPFGVDTRIFTKLDGFRNQEYITIGTVKRMEHIYGIDILLRSFANAFQVLSKLDSGLSKRLRLLLVGDGIQLSEYQTLSKELGIEGIVEFTGFIINKKVPEYLNKMDIYVALSRSESFGVAIVEASACSLPVIVSNRGGLPEVVKEGETGVIIEGENIIAATEAMVTLIQNEELRNKMGKAGREFVQEKYEWSKCIENMNGIYKHLTFLTSN